MLPAQRIALVVIAVALIVATLVLVRRGHLKRGFAWLWAGTAALVLLFAVAPALFETVGGWFGVEGQVLMAAVGVLVVLGAVIGASALISRAGRAEAAREQEIEALRAEVEHLREELRELNRPQPERKPRPPALRT